MYMLIYVFILLLIDNISCYRTIFNLKMTSTSNLPDISSVPKKTAEVFKKFEIETQVGGAGGSSSLQGLIGLNDRWNKLKSGGWKSEPLKIVEDDKLLIKCPDTISKVNTYDIIVCGGTLGIFYAIAMSKIGYKTCIVERGIVAGRPQEWNISRKELSTLVRLNILTESEIESVLGIEFNPVRIGFKTDTSSNANPNEQFEVYTKDVLNLGVRPDKLIALVKQKYIEAGGVILEEAALQKVKLYEDAAIIERADGLDSLKARLVLDAMGGASPIARQQRGTQKPDGICVVVGTCARGFSASNNTYSDLIYTDTPITEKERSSTQYFWEAFPAGSDPSDRTTYLFTYMDAVEERPSIMDIIEDYWTLLPRYQGKTIDDLEVIRILYGMFPTYRSDPLGSKFPRILQVGDASGIQSPLSFGGFGSLTRHLERLVGAIDEAFTLTEDDELLQPDMLSLVNPYQPNLSACWMFQRTMSVPVGNNPKSDLIVGTLSNSFSAMEKLGESTMRPFLQDVLMPGPLFLTLFKAAGQDLLTPFKIVPHVGIGPMLDFFNHFFWMTIYAILHTYVSPVLQSTIKPILPMKQQFRINRWGEAWKFGSGLDYYDHEH